LFLFFGRYRLSVKFNRTLNPSHQKMMWTEEMIRILEKTKGSGRPKDRYGTDPSGSGIPI
jgi:hypothetical protein